MSLERKIYQSILKVLPKRNYFPLSEPEITKIDKTCTVFDGEFESDAGFQINLKKGVKNNDREGVAK